MSILVPTLLSGLRRPHISVLVHLPAPLLPQTARQPCDLTTTTTMDNYEYSYGLSSHVFVLGDV